MKAVGDAAAQTGSYSEPPVLGIILPLPPGVNNLYATVNGRRVLSSEAKRFKSIVREQITDMCLSGILPSSTVDAMQNGYLSLFIDFYFATPMKRDLDGGLKITQDALCEALGINDNRVVDIHLVKRIDPRNPRIEVQLETIGEGDWSFSQEYMYVNIVEKNGDTRGAADPQVEARQ